MAETKSVAGTQTEKNLATSYLNESQSYARYTFYAQKAVKESFFPIGYAFNETAANELRHAKIFLNFLPGGKLVAEVPTDSVAIGSTEDNLKIAIDEERFEGVKAYQAYADVADKEGFPVIASHFRAIAQIEQHHLDRFQTYLDQLQKGTIWKREKLILWQCLVCGYIYEGTEPPVKCPACDHPYQHYIALDIYQ